MAGVGRAGQVATAGRNRPRDTGALLCDQHLWGISGAERAGCEPRRSARESLPAGGRRRYSFDYPQVSGGPGITPRLPILSGPFSFGRPHAPCRNGFSCTAFLVVMLCIEHPSPTLTAVLVVQAGLPAITWAFVPERGREPQAPRAKLLLSAR
jgi:hypothetical protein